jgi:hypothetical protein
MSIRINHIDDISKMEAFLRGGSKGQFSIASEIAVEVIRKLIEIAKRLNVSIKIVTAEGETIATYTAIGAGIGGLLAWLLAPSPMYILSGTIVGGAVGFCAAHVQVEIRDDPSSNRLNFQFD